MSRVASTCWQKKCTKSSSSAEKMFPRKWPRDKRTGQEGNRNRRHFLFAKSPPCTCPPQAQCHNTRLEWFFSAFFFFFFFNLNGYKEEFNGIVNWKLPAFLRRQKLLNQKTHSATNSTVASGSNMWTQQRGASVSSSGEGLEEPQSYELEPTFRNEQLKTCIHWQFLFTLFPHLFSF